MHDPTIGMPAISRFPASATMYLGGAAPALAEAYVRTDHDALKKTLTFRWALRASYFAWGLSVDDRTGVTDATENRKGLHDARVALGA